MSNPPTTSKKWFCVINTEFPINVNSDMDDASQDNLNALKELGSETAQRFDEQLDEFVKFLV